MDLLPRFDPEVVAATPLGLYVHVPFCASRCGYCAFSTLAVGEHLDPGLARRYVAGVLAELELADRSLGAQRPPLTSIYLGGGTPTMLASAELGVLLQGIRDRFELAPDVEVSIESNPDGLAPGRLAELAGIGVTRISFGLQSTSRRVLRTLERSHDPERALAAVHEAHRSGIARVGLDLMHATPGETAADWHDTVRAAIDSGADHVSAYALSIEAGTRLAARVRSGRMDRPDDDVAAERYLSAERLLSAAGYEWYELSNWARTPAARSRHNLLCWRNQHWWGVGPGAHSHVAGHRFWNVAAPGTWLQRSDDGHPAVEGCESLDATAAELERLMLGIRLAEGVELGPHTDAAVLERLVADGLVHRDGRRVRLTLAGRLLADRVVLELSR